VGGTSFKKFPPHSLLFFIRCLLPALVAHRDVGVVTADEDLATGGDDVTVLVDTGIDGGFATAGADGFDLGNGVGDLKEAAATGEEMRQKVGAKSEAHYRNLIHVNDFTQLIYLFGCEELALVCDDDVAILAIVLKKGEDIGIGGHNVGISFKADARANDVCAVAIINRGLDEPNLHVAFFIVELGDERVCGLGRAHRAIFEI